MALSELLCFQKESSFFSLAADILLGSCASPELNGLINFFKGSLNTSSFTFIIILEDVVLKHFLILEDCYHWSMWKQYLLFPLWNLSIRLYNWRAFDLSDQDFEAKVFQFHAVFIWFQYLIKVICFSLTFKSLVF